MVYPIYIDPKKFKGFALVNWSTTEIAVTIKNDASFSISFILKSKDIYYARVGDVVEFLSLEWAHKSHIRYLENIPELKDWRGRIR